MSKMLDLRCDPQDVEGLHQEIRRRNKIIHALADQVERFYNGANSDFALLQTTYILEEQVRLRTMELKRSTEELETFIANASVGVVFTHDRQILRYNRRFGEIFGFTGNEAVGRPDRILFRNDEEYLKVSRVASPLLFSGHPFHTELFMQRADGTDLWINLIGYVNSSAQARQGTIWLLEDRTSVKRADEALKHSYGQLEERVAQRTQELTQQLHFVQQLIEAIPGPVYYKDTHSRYLGCNRAYENFTGKSAQDLIGKTPLETTAPELAENYMAADRELLEHPGSQIYEGKVRFASGEYRDVMFHKATFTLAEGEVGGVVGLMLDITDRKRMEENLQQAATVFESAAEGVVITKTDGTIIAVNRAFTEITQYSREEALGKNPRMLQSGRHGHHFYRDLWATVMRDGRWQGEIWNRRKNGDIYPEWLSISSVRDEQGNPINFVATFSDITRQKQNEEHIQQLAFSDALTRLPNRRLLLDRLQHALATSLRNRHYGALLFIDLDDFKNLNDTRGHDVGDLLLQQVARRLQSCVREGDTVARFGGDEFVVVLEDLSERWSEATSQVRAASEKILSVLNASYLLEDTTYHSTPSIGITLFGGNDASVDELLKQADLAMYKAKGSGRNSLCFFDPAMQTAVNARVMLEADLRTALRENQLFLLFQPQISFAGEIVGAEALVRWRHPLRGIVSPGDFISLAEETELIHPLGIWVLETACEQLQAWSTRPETAPLSLAINVSAEQFSDPEFVDLVKATLDAYEIGAGKLKLEITESLLLDHLEQIVAKMTALKSRGVSFSLDDFGTGYSSLSYLKRLPFDQLKIDQTFVQDILSDQSASAIAHTIVALAQAMGMDVIAEGVETEQQLSFLESIGCHLYQGYLFGRPLPLQAFEVLLKTTNSQLLRTHRQAANGS